jgi:hypothetical protein
VKFWPVYGREKTYTETQGTSHAHAEGYSSGSSWGSGTSSGESDGMSWRGSALDGTFSRGSNRGTSSSAGGSEGSSESDTHTESESSSVADIPIYHPTPYLEGEVERWGLEEQRHRLADALTMQLQRHCFIRAPGDRAQAVLVPRVEDYPVPVARIEEYEAGRAQAAGALTAEAADDRIAERTRRLEVQAQAHFDDLAEEPVHSQDEPTPRAYDDYTELAGGKRTLPKPRRPKGSA